MGCEIYLSQDRCDNAFAIKELASKMSCPTTGSLRKMGKLIGYLKAMLGQYSVLEMMEAGNGLVTRCESSGWLVETFSDSDWSGAKGHRRSNSSAIHLLNGAVILQAQEARSVSLSSAEAELNALVAAATDGIYLRRRCLEFLTGSLVTHHFLVDNSAALHLCHRRGPGKLRHIAGKLLWVQDLVSQEELKVKSVGTVRNVSNLGTKRLWKMRIQLILYGCNVYNAKRQRNGQDEYERMETSETSRGHINKLAMAGSRVEQEEIATWTTFAFTNMVVVCMVLLLAVAAWLLHRMWKKIKKLETQVIVLEDGRRMGAMAMDAFHLEFNGKLSDLGSYVKRTEAMWMSKNFDLKNGGIGTTFSS